MRREPLHLAFQLGQFLLQPLRLQRQRLRRFLPIDGVKLAQIARDTFFELRPPPFHFAGREVLVAIVYGLELAAVDGDAGLRQQADLATQIDEPRTELADGRTIVLTEISDRLVIGREAAKQPQYFEIAAGLALQPAARLHAVEIAADVELEENHGVIRRSTRCRWIDTGKAKLDEFKRINEGIDRTDRIVLVDPVIEAFGQQCRLPAIRSLYKACHDCPVVGKSEPPIVGLSPLEHHGVGHECRLSLHSDGQTVDAQRI